MSQPTATAEVSDVTEEHDVVASCETLIVPTVQELSRLHSTIGKLRWSRRLRGNGMTLLTSGMTLLRQAHSEWYWKLKERAFDHRHRVETRGLIWMDDLEINTSEKEASWGYMATQPEWFALMLEELGIDFRERAFVDFGSGMGRSLLLASEFPFAKIIGVEFIESLHQLAKRNIPSWQSKTQQCHDITSHLGDAREFDLPSGPMVLYFYNPFKEELFGEVLARIEHSLLENPRAATLIYANPTCCHLLHEANWLTQKAQSRNHDPEIVIFEAG